jgi:general L-amino acid transport system substrate-binding protein
VDYAVLALIQAEEMGITTKNVDEMLKSNDPLIQRFLGVTPGNGKALGLDEKWAYNIIKLVGNYGEVFERNVGKDTPLKLERGLNALWTEGGLMYTPPFK